MSFGAWSGLVLLNPWLLLVLALVPLAAWRAWRRGAPAIPFAPLAVLGGRPLPRTWRHALAPVARGLLLLGLVCAVVALARPARSRLLPRESEGIDILLLLDTSSSMATGDMDRNRTRLAVARDAAERFVRGRPHDRIGLLLFARYPDLRCPPTRDHAALARLLEAAATVAPDGPEDATGIGTALARAAQVLHDGGARSPVVILLTDGEENVATAGAREEIAPAHAAQLCERLGVRVYTIAAGAPRDTTPLKRIAARTGGEFHAAADAAALGAVYARIDALEKTVFAEPRYAVQDHYVAFLGAALLCLFLGRLLAAGRIP